MSSIQLSTRRPAHYVFIFLLCFLSILYLISRTWYSTPSSSMGSSHKYTYDIVPGYFLQSDSATDPAGFDYAEHNFGLIDRHYPNEGDKDVSALTQWQRFTSFVHTLPLTAPPGTTYKLIYLARHGEGYHNVAEAYYGTKAWDDYWSKLDGNGTSVWSDSHLTSIGEEQARTAGAFFSKQFADDLRMPVPDAWVVSPLMRCLETASLTWDDLDVGFRPVIKEMVREVMGEHTCDRRSTRTVIRAKVPEWEIEEGFAERDELWRADHRETWAEHDVRTRSFLDELFALGDAEKVVSVTAHSGTIASFLRVTGHRRFVLPTGGMIPIFVKATKNEA